MILTRRAWNGLASSGHTHTTIVAVRPRYHLTFNSSNDDSPNLSRLNVRVSVGGRNIDRPIGRDWEMRIQALKRGRHIPASRDGWSASRVNRGLASRTNLDRTERCHTRVPSVWRESSERLCGRLRCGQRLCKCLSEDL